MKKLFSVLAGILLFAVVLAGFKLHMNSKFAENKPGVRNLRSYERFWSSEAQKIVIDEKTLPIFGSSELIVLGYYEDNVASFLNGEQMNILSIGGGNFQSLHHAITLGALSDSISSGKIALFLSPQWFDEDGSAPAAFAARMSENALLDFLSNKKISDEQKQYVLDRVESLLAESPIQQARVQKYKKAFHNPISADWIYMQILNAYWDYRAEFEAYQQLDAVNNNVPHYDLDAIDFDAVLELAEQQGKESCTNNDFGIRDDYWSAYVESTYEAGEVVDKRQVFTQSPEYDDLKCFLNIADELGLEVILVSIPVNGRWYAYCGELCDEYYQNIRDISAQYSNVQLVDMSIYEDEPYFFRDIMHLGWKGWARINEVLYTKFTKE